MYALTSYAPMVLIPDGTCNLSLLVPYRTCADAWDICACSNFLNSSCAKSSQFECGIWYHWFLGPNHRNFASGGSYFMIELVLELGKALAY